MTLIQQIFWGSVVLCGCLLLETAMLVWCGWALRRHLKRFPGRTQHTRMLGGLSISIGFVVAAHTAQIWIWSAVLVLKTGAFETWNTAVYFSISTYTTLGYGDVILDEAHRILASFAAMTGMLAFGISTAFLVSSMRPVLSSADDKPAR